MKINMLNYYKTIRDQNVDIIYSGPIWAEGLEGIAGVLRKRLDFDELPLSLAQSIFSVFVEQVNNMLMYSDEKGYYELPSGKRETPTGAFILGSSGKRYFLQSGNAIRADKADDLKKRIDHLNTLDKPGLRKFYKEQIKTENLNPESRGAGLGFIEIARRANSPIEYEFTSLTGGMMFFSMYVTIGQED